jgi:hypothetical protein
MPADRQTSYDRVPCEGRCYPQAQPDRLATVATLLGLSPPPVTRCRVLELGCATGANLIADRIMCQAIRQRVTEVILEQLRGEGQREQAVAVAEAGQPQPSGLQGSCCPSRQQSLTSFTRQPDNTSQAPASQASIKGYDTKHRRVDHPTLTRHTRQRTEWAGLMSGVSGWLPDTCSLPQVIPRQSLVHRGQRFVGCRVRRSLWSCLLT